jgi:hypothetical protein
MFVLLKLLRWLYAPSRAELRILEEMEDRKQRQAAARHTHLVNKSKVWDNLIYLEKRSTKDADDHNKKQSS